MEDHLKEGTVADLDKVLSENFRKFQDHTIYTINELEKYIWISNAGAADYFVWAL